MSMWNTMLVSYYRVIHIPCETSASPFGLMKQKYYAFVVVKFPLQLEFYWMFSQLFVKTALKYEQYVRYTDM